MTEGSGQAQVGPRLLSVLRARSKDLHRRLDDEVAANSLLDVDGYIRFLIMHARVLPAAEAWLAAQPEFREIPDAEVRLRSSALHRDLQLLDIPPPKDANMSFLNERTSVVGISYVLEGSRLGGAYLTTMLARHGREYPLNFLRHGQNVPLWKTFVEWLSTRELTDVGIDSAAAAAENMFAAYLAALD